MSPIAREADDGSRLAQEVPGNSDSRMLKSRSLAIYVSVWILAVFLAESAWAQQRPAASDPAVPPAPGDMSRLAEGVYVRIVSPDSDAVGNAGVVILESGVLVFDTHFTPEAGDALMSRIKLLTPLPVRLIINSHFHPDHTHGNQAFAGARMIVGSSNTRRDMLQEDIPALNQVQTIALAQVEQLSREIAKEPNAKLQEALRAQLGARQAFLRRMSALKILPPVMTLDDSLNIMDGGREVRLLCLGDGHTDGDIVMVLPEAKIAFLGDLFFNGALPNVEDACVLDWMKTLKEVLKLDVRTYVPGHGPVGTKSDVELFLNYFEELKGLVGPAVKRGDTLEQVVSDLRLPARYSTFGFRNFFAANLQKMYAELKALEVPVPAKAGVKKRGVPR
jgi:glyoxylase-like metal-dependent hydrolase (beta-lactamase superfamily II)